MYSPTETAAVRGRYGPAAEFISTFAPSKQAEYCADLCRVYTGTAPSLLLLKETYGADTPKLWLMVQLQDLAEFAGCREKLTAQKCEEIALLIMARYGYLKASVLMHFFLRVKLGDYGEFYGAVDPMRIMSALRKFEKERQELQQRYEKERQEHMPKLREHTCDFVDWYNSLSDEEKASLPPQGVALVQKFIPQGDAAEK